MIFLLAFYLVAQDPVETLDHYRVKVVYPDNTIHSEHVIPVTSESISWTPTIGGAGWYMLHAWSVNRYGLESETFTPKLFEVKPSSPPEIGCQ